MHLVVGLGNPGKKYEANRHNVGFRVANAFSCTHTFPDFKEKFNGLLARGSFTSANGEHPVALLKPSTFMNLSGGCVQAAAGFLKVDATRIIVVHDELDIPWRDVRAKVGGGHAGHNGVRSLISTLGTPSFARVRVGIGRPPPDFKGDVADFVLQNFDPSEEAEMRGVIDGAMAHVIALIIGDASALRTTA